MLAEGVQFASKAYRSLSRWHVDFSIFGMGCRQSWDATVKRSNRKLGALA